MGKSIEDLLLCGRRSDPERLKTMGLTLARFAVKEDLGDSERRAVLLLAHENGASDGEMAEAISSTTDEVRRLLEASNGS
ncbi:MAG TPA: hypothetical protein VGJ86_07695 [Acidimicrobiales bacterium]